MSIRGSIPHRLCRKGNEVNALSEKDLEFIIILKIQVAQGQLNGTFHSSQNNGQKTAT
jgi:hypothetical protein